MSNIVLDVAQKIIVNDEKLRNKKIEIEKRREVITTLKTCDSFKKTVENKEDNIEHKIKMKRDDLDAKTRYYESQIRDAQDRMQREIEKSKETFEKYKMYCMESISRLDQRINSEIDALNKKISTLDTENDENADRILIKLKFELETLEKENKKLNDDFQEAMEKKRILDEEIRQRFISEEREKMFQIQRIEMEHEVQKQRAFEESVQRERLDIKKKNLILREKEMKEKEKKKEEEDLMKELRIKFKKGFLQQLNENELEIYTFLNEESREHVNEMITLETLEEVKEYLMNQKKDMDTITSFLNKPGMITKSERDVFDMLGYYEKLKVAKIKDRIKRKEMLEEKEVKSDEDV